MTPKFGTKAYLEEQLAQERHAKWVLWSQVEELKARVAAYAALIGSEHEEQDAKIVALEALVNAQAAQIQEAERVAAILRWQMGTKRAAGYPSLVGPLDEARRERDELRSRILKARRAAAARGLDDE